MRSRLLAALLLAALATAGCGQDHPGGRKAKEGSNGDVVLTPQAAAKARKQAKSDAVAPGTKAHVVQLEGAGAKVPKGAPGDAPSPGVASDAQVRAELKRARADLKSFRSHLSSGVFLQEGPRARVLSNGSAVAPRDAPAAVKRVILAGNEIAKFPYKWGGGHGAWRDNGYDCSGSVSFALAGARLLNRPLTSGAFASWGEDGPGDWITIYANGGHVFMLVAGLRFDTSGQGRAGTRWQPAARPAGGFAVRHPAGY